MSDRLYQLTAIHQRIDDRLREEQRRRWPNGLELNRLKRLKLRAKDMIARLTLTPRRSA